MNEAELKAQFEKEVRALYPEGETSAVEREVLLELAVAQGLSRGAAESVLRRCLPGVEAPALSSIPPVEAMTPPPADLSALVESLPASEGPLPALKMPGTRAVVARLIPAEYAWVLPCVVAPLAALALVGAGVMLASTWWGAEEQPNRVTQEIENVSPARVTPPLPGEESEPQPGPSTPALMEQRAGYADFRDVFPGRTSSTTVEFELPETPGTVVNVPETLRRLLRVRQLPQTRSGQLDEEFIVEGKPSGASGWRPILHVRLDARSRRVTWTADPPASALRPGFVDHLVVEVTDEGKNVIQRCRRRMARAELLKTVIHEGDGKVDFGTVELPYPWPDSLTVRPRGETEGRSMQPGVQSWTRGQEDPIVVDVHLSVKGGDVGLSLRSTELEKRCRELALARAAQRKAEEETGKLSPEAAVSHDALERKRFEAQRYREGLQEIDKAYAATTGELKKVSEALARGTPARKEHAVLQARQRELQRQLSTLDLNRPRTLALLKRANEEIAELQKASGTVRPAEPKEPLPEERKNTLLALDEKATHAKVSFEGSAIELVDAWGLVVATVTPRVVYQTP